MCIMLDGRALASVRVARGLESVLGVGSEFVVFVLSVVRHVDINLARFATRERRWCLVSSARTSGRRSAKEGASDAPYRGWKGGVPKTFSDALGAYKSPSPGRANSQVHLPYPKAQCEKVIACLLALPGPLENLQVLQAAARWLMRGVPRWFFTFLL